MKQENRQQYGLRFEFMESRQQVYLRGNPEHEGAEQKINRENVHRADNLPTFHVQRRQLAADAAILVTCLSSPFAR